MVYGVTVFKPSNFSSDVDNVEVQIIGLTAFPCHLVDV